MTKLKQQLSGYQVRLEQVDSHDIEQLRTWRNDPAVAQFMLTQESISKQQQQAWFQKIQRDSSQQHFVIWYKNEAIGAANIKTFYQGETLDAARAIEPGLYIADPRYRSNILAFAPTLLLNDYCFDVLATQSLVAVVKASNQAALNYNFKLGYRIEKQAELVEIRLNAADYQQHTAALKALLNRPVRHSEK
jgi:RimJ/RimL family protein N-acetyltransferase